MTYTSEDASFRARLLSDLGFSEDPRWSITELLKRHRTQVLTKEGLGIPVLSERVTDIAINVKDYGAVGDGVTDDTAAIQAAIDATPTGSFCLIPTGEYKITSTLNIFKSIKFGGVGTPSATNDNSNQQGGVRFYYTSPSGNAILVQSPLPDGANDNGKISPILCNFALEGNKNIGGATSGGGLTLDGRAVANSAITHFLLENIKISEAKGTGFTLTGDIYEGKITGLSSFKNGEKGVHVGTTGNPGELLWEDIHTNDNVSDGAYFDNNLGNGYHQINRWSSSRNGANAFYILETTANINNLQCESNAGSEVVTIDSCKNVILSGLNIDYTEPTYTGTGLAIKGTSENTVVISPDFSGTATTWDITTAGTTQYTLVITPRWSKANPISIGTSFDTVLQGGVFNKGTLEAASDATDRTPFRVRGFTGQTEDLAHILNSTGSVLARVTSGGSIRSSDDLIARLGSAAQTSIGEVGANPGVYFGNAGDTNLYRSAANVLKTDDKLNVALDLEVDGALDHDGTTAGFYGVTPVTQPTALTAADASAVNSGDATTDTVINNMRTRIEELETKLRSLGLIT